MNNENSNIKDLIDMCKTTVETVGDVTVCKELPESTLEVVHEMIRVLFYCGVVNECDEVDNIEDTKTALTKQDLIEGGWWVDATNINKEALIGLGLKVSGHNENFDSPDFKYEFMFYSDYENIVDQVRKINTNLKEIELINGSFYYV